MPLLSYGLPLRVVLIPQYEITEVTKSTSKYKRKPEFQWGYQNFRQALVGVRISSHEIVTDNTINMMKAKSDLGFTSI